MEYERKYKAALKWMQSLYGGLHGVTKEEAEHYFPELKDSEDERIVKCLLNYFNHVRYNGLDLKGTDVDEVIAWLEKQGEKVTNINGEDCGIDGLYHAIKILERTVGRVTGYQSDDGILSHEAAIDAVKELYKKQGRQEHFYDFNANDWYVSKVDGKIHNMTYNPTDKVKPKFKVGDWITNGDYTWKIVEVKPLHYILQSQDGNIVDDTISYVDEQFHSFTIEDAKDGDVLVTTAIRNCPFIYRKTDYNNNLAYYYAGIDGSGDFCEGCIKRTSYHFGPLSNVVLATKEQRDQLFQKMEKAGYKWNAEKKELKKIEVVSKESKDERIKKTIIRILKGETGYTSKEDTDKYIAWVEKQGDKDKLIRELGEYKVKYTQKVLQEDLNKIESQSQPKFKVGDKVTIEGDDTIYTIGSIDHESCWLTLEDSGVGWATFGVLKHYVE